MDDRWKSWEGRVVNGEIPLVRFLGGSEHSGVFLADKSAGGKPQTAVKFVPAASVDANDQLRQWKAAAELDHPNVIRIFESGRCEMEGSDYLYVLMEYADEDLSQLLPQRALTDEETRQVLQAVLNGLAYVHDKGLVHGRVKPSNILASGDAVKLSSDSLRPADEPKRQIEKTVYDAPEAASRRLRPSADVWSLGVTLVEVLTKKLPAVEAEGQVTLPAGMPEVFQEIAGGCLQVDPGGRCTVAEIQERLAGGEVAPPPATIEAAVPATATPAKSSASWVYGVVILAAVVIGAIVLLRPKNPGVATEARTEPALSESKGVSAPHSDSGSETRAGAPAPQRTSPKEPLPSGDVLERVMPRISPSAQNTIKGTIHIVAIVDVDAAGTITGARLQNAGPSKYFARLVLDAARQWKFKPALENGQAVASEWKVRFTLRRNAIDDSAERVRP